MTQLVKQAEVVNSSAYEFDGALDFSTNYFWRVMSMEPAPSDWSATFSFQTEAKPVPPPTTPEEQKIPIWAWAVIAIGTILVTVTLVLIFKMRRV
jgi:subtilase family serine protease